MKETAITICIFVLLITNAFSKVEFNWGIDEALYHQIKIAREFKKAIEKKSGGEVQINIKPYDITKLHESSSSLIQSNKFQIHQTFVEEFANAVPEFGVFQIPFLFESNEHIERFLTSPRAVHLLKKIENKDYIAVNYSFAGGFLHYYSQNKMNDFSLLKNSDCYSVKSYGFTEMFLNQQGVQTSNRIDARDYRCGELLSSEINTLYQYEKPYNMWINLTAHRVITRATVVSKVFLHKLSKKNQNIFIQELAKHLEKERHYVYEASALSLKLFKNRGGHINVWTYKERNIQRKKSLKLMSSLYRKHDELINFINSLNNKDKLSKQTAGK